LPFGKEQTWHDAARWHHVPSHPRCNAELASIVASHFLKKLSVCRLRQQTHPWPARHHGPALVGQGKRLSRARRARHKLCCGENSLINAALLPGPEGSRAHIIHGDAAAPSTQATTNERPQMMCARALCTMARHSFFGGCWICDRRIVPFSVLLEVFTVSLFL